MTESQLVNQICEGLLWQGYFIWRQNNIPVFDKKTNSFRKLPKFTPKGVADIIGLTPEGKFFCVECKIKPNRQTDCQLEFQKNIEEKKGIYILAYCWEDVDNFLKKYLSLPGPDCQFGGQSVAIEGCKQ